MEKEMEKVARMETRKEGKAVEMGTNMVSIMNTVNICQKVVERVETMIVGWDKPEFEGKVGLGEKSDSIQTFRMKLRMVNGINNGR